MIGSFENVLFTPGHLMSLAARGFFRLSERRLKPFGFAPGQLPILIALQSGKATNQRDLARFAKVEQPPMAQMLARMERDGLIEKTPDPSDGRSSHIVLTSVAVAAMPEAISALHKGNDDAMRGFSETEVAQFIDMLTRVIGNLDKMANPEHELTS